ncbi:hypothetical protein B0T16DRAFT_407386 [Cercophora newfieldiana]|uniref:Uncharacterized protein n=1 Tax=Cercophora newfieldiana TaxID=92897 RepID=A0AA40CXS1_9PEZI|nr:hypothetical protein B0T16DRAFT_407386 [Cercophora newfieldiana]
MCVCSLVRGVHLLPAAVPVTRPRGRLKLTAQPGDLPLFPRRREVERGLPACLASGEAAPLLMSVPLPSSTCPAARER